MNRPRMVPLNEQRGAMLCPLSEVDHNFRTTLTGAIGCILATEEDNTRLDGEILCELQYFHEDGEPFMVIEKRIRVDLIVQRIG